MSDAELVLFDRMALSLNLWYVRILYTRYSTRYDSCSYRTALTLGILYLTFEAFPLIFGRQHGFDSQQIGLAFLGMGVGLIIALASQGLWNRYATLAMIPLTQ